MFPLNNSDKKTKKHKQVNAVWDKDDKIVDLLRHKTENIACEKEQKLEYF